MIFGDERSPSEPWIDLPNAKRLLNWNRDWEINYNQQSRAAERARFFRLAFDYLTDSGIKGDFHEFGCHRARTFRMALTEARRHNLHGMDFFAYDSFAGLPDPSEHDISRWTPGTLTTSYDQFWAMIEAHGIYVDRVNMIGGFYKDTLPSRKPSGPIAFANIDCDLYESAAEVLRFIDPHLSPGAVVYLDDWFPSSKGDHRKGVVKAWLERKSQWNFVDHMTVGWWGKSFIAVPL